MTTLASLAVNLELQTAEFQRGVEKANGHMRKLQTSTKRIDKQLSSAGRQFKSFVGQAIAFAGISFGASFLKGVIETNSQLAKNADTLGLGIEAYQELQFAAERSGIATSQFTSNMTAFVKRVGEARQGVGPLVSGLKDLDQELLRNIVTADGQEAALKIVADAIKNADSAAERAAITNAAFSRSGVAMVAALKDGAEGLNAFAAEAHNLGLVIEEDLIRSAERYDDQLLNLSRRISATFGAGFLDLVTTVLDSSTKVFNAFFATVEKGVNTISAGLERAFALFDLLSTKNILRPAEALREYNEVVSSIDADLISMNAAVDAGADAAFTYENEVIAARAATEAMNAEARKITNTMGAEVPAAFEKATKSVGDFGAVARQIEFANIDAEFFDDFADGMTDSAKQVDKLNESIEGMAADGITDMVLGFGDAEKSFGEFATSFIKDIAAMIIKQQLFNALSGAFDGAVGGLFGGGKAGGGPVAGGTTYLVGERGPELFTPATSGAITSNEKLGSTTVNINNYSGGEASVSQTEDNQGNINIDVLVSKSVKAEMRRGGFDSINKTQYGMKRRGY
ncbi:hypothetical protein DRH27_00545 [Candidatus Falkowbacteria bacterium]|nr:MAG: hypothetical protein DRH27_00545 [Candidatus Falkowbacteria bacterium]